MVTILNSVPRTVHNNQTDLGDKKVKGQQIQLGPKHCMRSSNRAECQQHFCTTNGTRITNLHHSYVRAVAVLNSQNKQKIISN
jgi:hypothetical protein